MLAIISFFLGFCVGIITLIVVTGYYYYKAVDEAHKEGWDMPN